MDPFEYQGYWWLPENVENKHPGTLSFSHEEGLRLETLGSFSLDALKPGKSKSLGVIKQYPVIKGVTREGKYFTLFGSDSGGLSIRAPGLPSQIFTPVYAFEEEMTDLERESPNAFHRALVQFSYLADWLGASGIRQNIVVNDEAKRIERLEIIYELQDKITADVGQAKISIVEGYKSSGTDRDVRGISLNPHFSLEIEVEQELTFEGWSEQFIGPLGDFLTLATRRSNAVTRLLLYSKRNQIEVERQKGEVKKRLTQANLAQTQIPEPIFKDSPTKIYYRQAVAQRSREAKTIDVHNMLFGFRDVRNELEQILGTWFSKRKEYESTMDLFFAVENSSKTSLDNEFLNLSQALEVYHRKRFNSTVRPETVEEHKEKIKAVVDAAPEEYREWLDSQLSPDRRVNLNQRISELLEYLGAVISKLVRDQEAFARKVTKTRNFLTHYSKKQSNAVMEGEELFRATQVLSYMIQTCIMFELGLPQERIVALFKRDQKYLQTALFISQSHFWQ